VRRLRTAQNMNYTQLSEKLAAAANWEINPVGIRRIEAGERRVTPDDLMALAVALNVSPITLLMPETAAATDVIEVTGRQPDVAWAVWDWLRGFLFRDFKDADSVVASNPPWAVDAAMQLGGIQRAQRRIADGVALEDAHKLGEIRLGDDQ
jgi:transcriptional regulator with XRE-family HTH domain